MAGANSRRRRNIIGVVFLAWLVGTAVCGGAPDGRRTTGSLLVIAMRDSAEENLSGLLALRRTQGWKVAFQLAAGASPEQIIKQVKAEKARNPALSHLLLVGRHQSLPLASQPNYLIQRGALDRPILTDDPYGLPDVSGVPVLAVGRLPADASAALKRLAEKIVRYERERVELAREVFFLAGRQPADSRPIFGRLSPQTLVDGASGQFIADAGRRLTRLKLRVRTAFPGPDHFAFADGPRVLREGLARRPLLTAYAGHAGRDCFATYHSPWQTESIQRKHLAKLSVPNVCGLFYSGGCSMVDPRDAEPAIGHQLLQLEKGPAAVVAFTGLNEDYCVTQLFEMLLDELTVSRETTMGEFILRVKRRHTTTPLRPRAAIVRQFMKMSGMFLPELKQIDYAAVVAKNNAMLLFLGDPCCTYSIP